MDNLNLAKGFKAIHTTTTVRAVLNLSMREPIMRDIRTTALIAFAALSLASAPAIAGDWSGGCGICQPRYYGPASTYYAQPTYTYAAPTVTIVPHVVVEPNYIVQRTYVVRQDQYVGDFQSCWFGCEPHRVVNQGQYPTSTNWAPSTEYTESRQADGYRGYRGRSYGPRIARRYAHYYRRSARSSHSSRPY